VTAAAVVRAADVVVGCDIGTQTCKGLALDAGGRVVARAARAYPLEHPHPGWAQQDPRHWTAALGSTVAELVRAAGGRRIAAIGIAGQVDGIAPVDERGEPLGPALIWIDRRATREAEALGRRFDAQELRRRTGLNLDASHGAPKIAWLRAEAERRSGPHAHGYLLPVTHAVEWLTGERVIDPANASTTMLFELSSGDWAPDLLDAVGVERGALGRVLPAHAVCGGVLPSRAADLGVAAGTPVIVGTGDEHAACLAAGILEPGIVADITGTAEPVAAAAATALRDPTGLLETHPHAAAGRWLLENPGFVSGGSVRWLANAVLGVHETEVTALAAAAPAGSDGLLFVPALGGAVTPRWNDRARGTFHGLHLGHDRRHLARAVLEGCSYALRDIVDRLDAMGLAGERVRVLGGGARDTVWPSIKADVTGRTMERLAEPEATALGAALLAAVGAGWYADTDTAVGATLRLLPDVVSPDHAMRAIVDEGYARYRAVFDALEPIDMGV
jgi:xylulokinase